MRWIIKFVNEIFLSFVTFIFRYVHINLRILYFIFLLNTVFSMIIL